MCGRYALGIRASAVRYQLQQNNMRVDDAPEDDEVRQTYNFAPGSQGLVYRADVPDYGAGNRHHRHDQAAEEGAGEDKEIPGQIEDPKETQCKLQSMKWGLVPFWTKRNPDYGTVMKSINARDDSLAARGGMWNTMKKGKRCIVVAQGFYEWLKKNGVKEKIPHYTKRKDGQLMCFAGLWDCVQYEGIGSEEKYYTYTIITADSNKQLSFLHDRMPVILENGSEEIRIWLDPIRSQWSKELQSILKPYNGELECYPVSKEVGKVGNNSPTFIVPIASTENRKNIANFFSGAKKTAKGEEEKELIAAEVAAMGESAGEHADGEKRVTAEQSGFTNNGPLPVPASTAALLETRTVGTKRVHDSDSDEMAQPAKLAKKIETHTKSTASPEKPHGKKRSATSNHSKGHLPKVRDGSQQITKFFNK